MKKLLYIILTLILIFVGLLYWSVSSTDKRFAKSRLIHFETHELDTINFRNYDSVFVAASYLYKADDIKTLMQGEQYRMAWATPVKAQIVYLDTLFGGVSIIKEGGGNQTHSLKLKAPNGILYALRSINKDPDPLVPEFLKTLGLENLVIDGISAQHPYAAILVAKLSDAANIIHTVPQVVFVPKQDFLHEFNEKYGNRLFLLEFETEGDVNWTDLERIVKIVDTEDLQLLKKQLGPDLKIDERALIRARLFDFIVGDWDRHTKQWGWAVQRNDSSYLAIPIASDRDNAFFNTDGIIPSLLTNKNVIPELRPFEEDIDFMEGLVYPFDRYFLLRTPKSFFISEANALQDIFIDEVIHSSLDVWPKNIADLNGKDILEKMKSRIVDLEDYAVEFHRVINAQGVLTENLKGSEDLSLPKELLACFECD